MGETVASYVATHGQAALAESMRTAVTVARDRDDGPSPIEQIEMVSAELRERYLYPVLRHMVEALATMLREKATADNLDRELKLHTMTEIRRRHKKSTASAARSKAQMIQRSFEILGHGGAG